MNQITTVILITGVNEDTTEINRWLNDHDLAELVSVNDGLQKTNRKIGNNIYIGAYNYFSIYEKDFLEKVFRTPWRNKEEVLLIIRRFDEQKIYQRDRFSTDWVELIDNA